MSSFPPVYVVNPRLSAPRGEEYSAGYQNQLQLASEGGYPDNEEDLQNEGAGLHNIGQEAKISEDNVGFKLLQKMGWKGKGLGKNEDGIVEPVKGGVEAGDRSGLGKAEQDSYYTSSENITRKRLEVEVQAQEDEERTRKREMQAEREKQIKQDVINMKRTFYCEVCHKQYNSAMEMDAHLSSYDHHHKKRLQEMKAMTAERTRGERLKKEQRQQEREQARLQAQIERAQQLQQSVLNSGPPRVASQSACAPASATPVDQGGAVGAGDKDDRQGISFGISSRPPGKGTLSGVKRAAVRGGPNRSVKPTPAKPAAASSVFGASSDEGE